MRNCHVKTLFIDALNTWFRALFLLFVVAMWHRGIQSVPLQGDIEAQIAMIIAFNLSFGVSHHHHLDKATYSHCGIQVRQVG